MATKRKTATKKKKAAAVSESPESVEEQAVDESVPPLESFVPDAADRELALRAVEKRRAGERPAPREAMALHRESVRRAVRNIPQKIWREMSGRQARTINEQADRYDLPFGGATVDLYALVPALHNFLARNKYRLAGSVDDPLMQGEASPALERYRDERAQLARLDRMEREGTLISREALREGWILTASIIRNAGEMLQRQFGHEASAILEDAMAECDRALARIASTEDETDDDGDE